MCHFVMFKSASHHSCIGSVGSVPISSGLKSWKTLIPHWPLFPFHPLKQICLLPWSKCIHKINLKGIILTFKQKMDAVYRAHDCVWCPTWLFLVKNANIFTFCCCVVNVFGVPFWLIGIHFDHYQFLSILITRIKFRFSNFCLSHRGSEVMVGFLRPTSKFF